MPRIRFRLNGVETDVDADPDSSLLAVLRGQLGMTGPHFGCGANECGACNVIVGDHAVAACDTPLWSVAGQGRHDHRRAGKRAKSRIRCSAPLSPNRRCNAAIAFPAS